MKTKWEVKNLGDICEISTGNSNTKDAVEDGHYAFFDRSKTIKKSSKYLFDCDAIIVAGEGQTFMPKFYSGKFDLHQRAYALINFDKNVSIHYVYKYLIHFHKYFEEVAVGATAKSLRLRHFQDLSIPIPSFPEQKQIVAILDKAFENIAKAKENAENNLKNAKEIFEGYLQNIFENKGEGWEEKKLGEVCLVIAGQSPEGKYYNRKGEGLPFYQGKKEFTNKYLGKPTTWTINVTKEAQKNDVLMSVRAPVGPINFSIQKICIGRGLAAIRAGKMIDKEFLFHFLLNHEKKIVGNTGAVFNSINKNQIENIKIYLPSLLKQQSIVAKLYSLSSETKKLEVIYQQKLNDFGELKKAILQKAFNGELIKE